MKFKQAAQLVRALGGTLKRNEYDEYIVKFGKATYFASDVEDAVGTAKLMAEKKQ